MISIIESFPYYIAIYNWYGYWNMKLQKYMGQSWICSRRKAEEYILAWLVKVNGQKAHIGQIIETETDKIEFSDEIVKQQKDFVYYKMNKPRWIVTTCAEYWDKNIIDIIDLWKRVFPVWRLDKESSWLILLTNDGRLTNYLIHPRYHHEKEYIVETFWRISDETLEKMSESMLILWSYTKKAKVKRISSGKFSIILTEGKNRQIRRMVEKLGSKVKKLKRIRIENIELWALSFWEYKALTQKELTTLFEKIGLPS